MKNPDEETLISYPQGSNFRVMCIINHSSRVVSCCELNYHGRFTNAVYLPNGQSLSMSLCIVKCCVTFTSVSQTKVFTKGSVTLCIQLLPGGMTMDLGYDLYACANGQ